MSSQSRTNQSGFSRREVLVETAAVSAVIGLGAIFGPKFFGGPAPASLDVAKGELTEEKLTNALNKKLTLVASLEFVEEGKRSLWIKGMAPRSADSVLLSGYISQGPFQVYRVKGVNLQVEALFERKLQGNVVPLKLSGTVAKDESGNFVLLSPQLED